MGGTSEFYCMVKSDLSDDVGPEGKPSVWTTFRWSDEFGNSIAPFFTSLEAGQPFLKEMDGWQLKRYPVAFVVAVILADIKQDTSFYTIDPVSTRRFKALSPVQFLTDLIYHRHPVDRETQALIHEHEDVIPLEAFFGEGRDTQAKAEYRQLLAAADVVLGIDLIRGTQSIVFGSLSLEELVRTGQSNILGVVNVGLGQEAIGLEKLAALVHDIKGHNEYCAAKAT